MANRFVEFYNDELAALRDRASRFAQAYPKIAGRLRISPDTSDDPHVERLVQSFAYSAARVRQKIDDNLPELTNGLLETLYPGYLAPLPSLSMVGFAPAETLDTMQVVPRGTEVTSEAIEGDQVRFLTTQDVLLAPISVSDVRLMPRPFDAPPAPDARAASCLRLTIQPVGGAKLSDLGLETLRFHLAGPVGQASALGRLMLQNCVGVRIGSHAADAAAKSLPAGALRPIGFDVETALTPVQPTGFAGYRTLTEFSALPEKFLYFDLALGSFSQTDRLDVFIYFDVPPDDSLRRVGDASVALHTTPVVNLFAAQSEPVPLDGTRTTYPLVADSRRAKTRQIHSVRHVTLVTPGGQTQPCQPFFHALTDHAEGGVFWQLTRHSGQDGRAPGDTSVSFVDARAQPALAADMTASIELLATNADLPRQLPFGGSQPRLKLASPIDSVGAVRCLQPPTALRRPGKEADRNWQLMSHLSLNHLSLSQSGAPALRNILRLYDPGDDPDTARLIDAIVAVDTSPGLTKVGNVTVPGTDVTLTFEPQRIEPGEAVVFGAVLDRFLGCYTTINAFTRLTLRFADRSDVFAKFPARSGEGALV